MDDSLIELAILGVLAERREIYPSFLAGELRRRAPLLPTTRIRPVLEQLWADRRVARLWHRYMLPVDVPGVRDKWLAMIERRRSDLESMENAPTPMRPAARPSTPGTAGRSAPKPPERGARNGGRDGASAHHSPPVA
jgi:hypothetical protein